MVNGTESYKWISILGRGERLLAFLMKMGEMHKISFSIDLEMQTGAVSQEGQGRW